MKVYFCCDGDRRRNVIEGGPLNGIDFLEVEDDPSQPAAQRQRQLFVHFVNPLAPGQLNAANVRIEGGERIRNVTVAGVESGADVAGGNARLLKVRVSAPGDFSTYTLRIIDAAATPGTEPGQPAGFDPRLSSIDFEFKALCRSDFDCAPKADCPSPAHSAPELDYLSRDYASLRRLMLDRMATIAPDWTDRSPADMGVMLVELLAYVGDYLSYQQDAIATEAYLGTARLRSSVRRHARLVDYPMHDGVNARAWMRVEVNAPVTLARGSGVTTTAFLTRTAAGGARKVGRTGADFRNAVAAGAVVFEPVADSTPLDPEHNSIRFHTWGDLECCLPKGATRADLRGSLPNLRRGQILVFAEVLGAQTGAPADADPAHRHAVRITSVTRLHDPIAGAFDDPPAAGGADVTRITWSEADALPFPLCISARREGRVFRDVSVAWGNIVLADHGETVRDAIGTMPRANPALQRVEDERHCAGDKPLEARSPRFRPRLPRGPVTFSAPYDHSAPAAAARKLDFGGVTASRMSLAPGAWTPRPDLLGSNGSEKVFVVEVESDGSASLRFGNGTNGMQPQSGTSFTAEYRVGNGAAGNVGADALQVIASNDVTALLSIDAVTNPLPAFGGTDPEPLERVRRNAPHAFRTQQRAVTPADYAQKAEQCDESIQRATASFRWTGSWRTVFVTVDRTGGREVDEPFEQRLRDCLERYRMAGHDLEVDTPRYVPLEIEMVVCVKPRYFAADVREALRERFSNRVLRDGSKGVFHPDRFTFGQPVYLSALYAAAQDVEGVDSVEITRFQRQGTDSRDALDAGLLPLERVEIARLDNDPNFREHGSFTLHMRGGR